MLNATQAALLEPLLSSAANNSLSWTTQPDATISLAFSGNDLTVYAPLSPMAGSFVPSVDGTAYAAVSAGANVGADDEITGGQVLWAVSGLADGNHTLELRNGGGDGGVGMLIVDYFRFATVGALCVPPSRARLLPCYRKTRLTASLCYDSYRAATTTTSSSAAVASSSAGASSSTAAAAAAASSSSSSSSTAGTASGISNSASIGIYAAAAVGGLALLGASASAQLLVPSLTSIPRSPCPPIGLLILTLFKWRRRRSASAADPSSPAPPASAGRRIGLNAPSSYIGAAGGGGRGSTTNPAPFQTSDGPSRAFHPLAESSTAGDMAEVGAGAAPIWAARQKSVRRPSGSGGAGAAHADQLDARGLPKPAYEQPLEMPVVPRRLADDGGAEGDGSHRPSIVSFGAATQVATTLRSPTALLPSGARPKSSAAEIGDFGGADAGGLTVPRAARSPGSFRDSRSIYSNDVASAGPSSPGANDGRFANVDVGHGQSVYSLGQYYDGEPAAHDADADDDGGSSYYGAGAGRESRRSSAAEGLHIATGGQWDEAGPAPLTPPMEDPPSARRRNPAANGAASPCPTVCGSLVTLGRTAGC